MKALLLSLLLVPAARAADVPFYLRAIETQKDVSALNENFRSLVNDLTKLRSDVDDIEIPETSTSSVLGSRSTHTVMCNGDQSFTNTTQATEEAVTGSTITLVKAGSSSQSVVKVSLGGYFNNNTAGGGVDLIVNGARYSLSGSNGTWPTGCFGTSVDCAFSPPVIVRSLEAGSHSFSLMGWRGGNPVTLRKSNPCLQFIIEEVATP